MKYKPGDFFNVGHVVFDGPKYRGLSTAARAAYFEFKRIYKPLRNGSLIMSCRMMAERLNCSKTLAAKLITELVESGLVEITQQSSYGHDPKATAYRLIEELCDVTAMRPWKSNQKRVSRCLPIKSKRTMQAKNLETPRGKSSLQ
jgi:hypothetical protein